MKGQIKSPKEAAELVSRTTPSRRQSRLTGYEEAILLAREKGWSYREIADLFREKVFPGSKLSHVEIRAYHLKITKKSN